MPNVEPEEILKFDFTPGIDIGFLPQEPLWGTTSPMLMGFLPKQGTSYYPYDPEDTLIKGESPEEAIFEELPPPPPGGGNGNGNGNGGGHGGGPGGGGPPGTIRPHKPTITMPPREAPTHYLSKGITFVLYLDAAAKITAQVEAKVGKKESAISKAAAKSLAAGYYKVTLLPNGTAKSLLGSSSKLSAEVVVEISYKDKTKKTLKQALAIAPAKSGKKPSTKGAKPGHGRGAPVVWGFGRMAASFEGRKGVTR